MKLNTYYVTALSLLCLLQTAASSKILVVYFFASKSHKNFATPIVNELAKRGHEIVYISGYKDKDVPGVTQVLSNTDVASIPGMHDDMFEEKEEGLMKSFGPLMNLRNLTTEMFTRSFSSKEVQKLMKSNPKFDLVMVNGFMNEFSYGWVHQFKAPIGLFSAGPPFPWLLEMMGNPLSLSHMMNMPFNVGNDGWSFFRKCANSGVMMLMHALRNCLFVPMVDDITREKFPDTPGVREVEKNVSLILSNTHFSYSGPRPFVPSIVEAAGVHCKPAQPLPKDLAEFVEGSGDDGFILFSFGSVVQASQMPDKYKKIFLEVFSKLPQRVLWKWETEKMEGLPKNVKLSKWLPQQDLLGHPKCRAFITHGGGLSTMEATYHGVPLVGFPFFGDQDMNMNNAENAGFAIKVGLLNLSVDKLLSTLKTIMTDPKYKTTVSHLSTHFRDQPDSPLDRAVYWIEYVIRHKGAPHLKPDASNYHWLQNHMVDVLAFFVLVLAVLLAFMYITVRLTIKIFIIVIRRICGGKKKVPGEKKSQ